MRGGQGDDTCESYCISDSRDLSIRLFCSSLLRAEFSPPTLPALPIQWTLGECFATHPQLFIRELKIRQDCFGLRYTSFQRSGLVCFSSPYSSLTYRP